MRNLVDKSKFSTSIFLVMVCNMLLVTVCMIAILFMPIVAEFYRLKVLEVFNTAYSSSYMYLCRYPFSVTIFLLFIVVVSNLFFLRMLIMHDSSNNEKKQGGNENE